MNYKTMCCSWTFCCVILVYCLCVSVAHPAMNIDMKEQQLLSPPPSATPPTEATPIDHAQGRASTTIGHPRQAAFLAALGAAAAPFFASLVAPLLSSLAGAVSSAILGKLQSGSELNLTTGEPLHYEAYMINVPNEAGPYLLLTNAADARRPVVATAASAHSQPSFTAANRRPSPHPQPSLKVTQHLGTVNVKPYAPYNAERLPVPTDNPAYPEENQREEAEDS